MSRGFLLLILLLWSADACIGFGGNYGDRQGPAGPSFVRYANKTSLLLQNAIQEATLVEPRKFWPVGEILKPAELGKIEFCAKDYIFCDGKRDVSLVKFFRQFRKMRRDMRHLSRILRLFSAFIRRRTEKERKILIKIMSL